MAFSLDEFYLTVSRIYWSFLESIVPLERRDRRPPPAAPDSFF